MCWLTSAPVSPTGAGTVNGNDTGTGTGTVNRTGTGARLKTCAGRQPVLLYLPLEQPLNDQGWSYNGCNATDMYENSQLHNSNHTHTDTQSLFQLKLDNDQCTFSCVAEYCTMLHT